MKQERKVKLHLNDDSEKHAAVLGQLGEDSWTAGCREEQVTKKKPKKLMKDEGEGITWGIVGLLKRDQSQTRTGKTKTKKKRQNGKGEGKD